jgi:hypothetical protein
MCKAFYTNSSYFSPVSLGGAAVSILSCSESPEHKTILLQSSLSSLQGSSGWKVAFKAQKTLFCRH